MTELMRRTLEHLGALVACDTRNPPRAIRGEDRLFAYLGASLPPPFRVEVVDHGEGCVSFFAVRGEPQLLFNVHLDTVPAVPSWSRDPFTLRVEGDRAVGLGAADTKGAAAALLAVAERTTGPLALLFTTDEEAGSSRCVEEFLARRLPFRGVLVGEPTGGKAVCGHRGIASAAGHFHGLAGHASSPRTLSDNAVHAAVRWAGRALAFAEAEEEREVGGLRGIRFNLGVLRGGEKSNIIADQAEVRFGVRPRPGEDPAELLGRLTDLAAAPSADPQGPARVRWQTTFLGPSLPAPGRPAEDGLALARSLDLVVGAPVDFWTEAALFSAAGLPALVLGPGEIAQAHAADEWVSLDSLAEVAATYTRLVEAGWS